MSITTTKSSPVTTIAFNPSGSPKATPATIAPPPTPAEPVKATEGNVEPNTPSQPSEAMLLLAKKERAISRQLQEMRQLKDELTALKPTASKGLTADEWKQQFLNDPSALGFTNDQLQSTVLGALSTDPRDAQIRELTKSIEELRTGQKTVLSNAEQAQKTAYDNALKQIDNDVKRIVNSTDAYEAVKAMKQESAVTALIEMTFKEEGTLLTVEDAAKQVEDYLLEQAKTLTGLKKLKPVDTTQEATQTPTDLKSQAKPTQIQPTLTNALSAQSKTRLTAEERRQRAILIAQGKLQ